MGAGTQATAVLPDPENEQRQQLARLQERTHTCAAAQARGTEQAPCVKKEKPTFYSGQALQHLSCSLAGRHVIQIEKAIPIFLILPEICLLAMHAVPVEGS